MNNDTKQGYCSFESGFKQGQEKAMAECSGYLDEAYLEGYKDCLNGIEPSIEDDELKSIMTEQSYTQSGRKANNIEDIDDLIVSGEILHMIEEAKKSLFAVRWRIYSSNIGIEEQKELAVKLINVADLLSSVQLQYTSDEMYRYLGYTK